MEPEEFLDPSKTVYKYNQVLTKDDLEYFYGLLLHEYKSIPQIFFLEREKILIAVNTVGTLIDWLNKEKNNAAVFDI